jgi:flagellar hook assembly protein FlgD
MGEAMKGVPAVTSLHQNWPNPFNPVTTVSFDISSAAGGSLVTVTIYDVLGREVTTLLHQRKEPGEYSVQWDASGMPGGVYLCRMQAGPYVQTRKLMILR